MDQTAYSSNYASHFGCNEADPGFLDCLRATPASKILTSLIKPWPTLQGASSELPEEVVEILDDVSSSGPIPGLHPVMPWGPVVDESIDGTPEEPYYAIQGGRGNNVDVIFGTNKDEGTMFVYAMKAVVPDTSIPITDADVKLVLEHFFDDSAVVDKALLMYPKSDYGNSNQKRAATIIRDFFFLCETRRSARAMLSQGNKVWTYFFVYPIHWIDGKLLGGNYHGSDLFFVFGNEFPPVVHGYNAKDKGMSNSFIKFWGNFAHHGNPNGITNGVDEVEWPNFEVETDLNLLMDYPTSIQSGLRSSYCELWDTLLPPAVARRPSAEQATTRLRPVVAQQ
jgi:carboxylesterase type B